MHIHILGICGTFMGGLATLARAMGYKVTGCDEHVYPPMSTQLASEGIDLITGYHPDQLALKPDLYVIGNVVTRGNPLMEAILDSGSRYISGPQWLGEYLLAGRWVMAVAGTHGKTTTTAMLTWLLENAGLNPSFLIGGVPLNFGLSARLTDSKFFVIEADEYDTAFFDKRSKFLHYRPRTAVLNNLEYDHADIFADLAAIETQFHHLIRTVPAAGRIIVNGRDETLARVIARGCWSEIERFGVADGWQIADVDNVNIFANKQSSDSGMSALARPLPVEPQMESDTADANSACTKNNNLKVKGGLINQRIHRDHSHSHSHSFAVNWQTQCVGLVNWSMQGEYSQLNALAAIAAAHHIGIPPEQSIRALRRFAGIKRRMEVRGQVNGITVYDDFAHHPTAIGVTIAGLRASIGKHERILAVFEPRSNTMKRGIMKAPLLASLAHADLIFGYGAKQGKEALQWDLSQAFLTVFSQHRARAFDDLGELVKAVIIAAKPDDHILVMSNGGFGGVHQKLLDALAAR